MAKDIYHDHVKAALILAGWTILDDPYDLFIDQTLSYKIDLAAEKFIPAEKDNVKILVEVKSFLQKSTAYDFHRALGQYLVYKTGLEENHDYSDLYLAVPNVEFENFFTKPFIEKVLKKYEVRVMSFKPNDKNFLLWKN